MLAIKDLKIFTIALMFPLFIGSLFIIGTYADNPISTYEVLIKPSESNLVEIDHIVIRGGTQEDIGYELAKIGIDKYNTTLIPYDDPIYGKSKEEYIHLHDPVLSERIKGIKRAYGLKEDDYSYDPTALLYLLSFPSCSAIFIPGNITEDGHSMGGKDLEWFYNPETDDFALNISTGKHLSSLAGPFRARNHVVELYPDDGYATLVIGSSDLNGLTDGINENGLAITALQDGDTYIDPVTNLAGGRTSGLSSIQMLRTVLENCATIKEAKEYILTNRISMPFMGLHFMISDPSGRVTIAEFDNTSRETIFLDYKNVPVPMTNYALHLHPDFTKIIPENAKDPHDDYYRMQKLHAYIGNHTGKYNESDVWNTMYMVQANASASAEGVLTGGTIRLVYMIVNDLNERSMTVKFYLRDGPINNKIWDTKDLIMSEPFTFKLNRS